MPWLWTMDFEKLIHTPNIPYFNPRSNPILSLFRSLKDNTSKASSPKIYLKVKESLSKTFYIPLSTPYEQLLCVAVAPACDWSILKRSFSKVFWKKKQMKPLAENSTFLWAAHMSSFVLRLRRLAIGRRWGGSRSCSKSKWRAQLRCSPQHVHVSAK